MLLREVLAVPLARFAADAAPAFLAAAVRVEEPVEDLARVEVLRAPRIAGVGRGRRARENQCIHGVISMPS